MDGKTVWICDYRINNFDEKPIRKVLPQKVVIRSNAETKKRVYYSESHFAPLSKKGQPLKKVIPLFDNTGFRYRTGTPLNVFTTEKECRSHFLEQCNYIADINNKWLESKKELHFERNNELIELQVQNI